MFCSIREGSCGLLLQNAHLLSLLRKEGVKRSEEKDSEEEDG